MAYYNFTDPLLNAGNGGNAFFGYNSSYSPINLNFGGWENPVESNENFRTLAIFQSIAELDITVQEQISDVRTSSTVTSIYNRTELEMTGIAHSYFTALIPPNDDGDGQYYVQSGGSPPGYTAGSILSFYNKLGISILDDNSVYTDGGVPKFTLENIPDDAVLYIRNAMGRADAAFNAGAYATTHTGLPMSVNFLINGRSGADIFGGPTTYFYYDVGLGKYYLNGFYIGIGESQNTDDGYGTFTVTPNNNIYFRYNIEANPPTKPPAIPNLAPVIAKKKKLINEVLPKNFRDKLTLRNKIIL